MRYVIEKNYKATITVVVENAADEGDALTQAANIAEEADINEFSITEELESNVLETN